ncbi:MAG TPA: hypothetical protein EYP58_03140, partial [bacterium (Candidatus Stahlbacteria)]|nr:hypothetical protein [Candidatus Stahlbacteria bacterium]
MYIIVSLIGGLLILDKYAIGIFGFSQPIVAGLIFGSLFGDLQTFIVLGAYLQLIYIAMLPIGRSIPPDGELGGITGLAIHALFPDLPLSVPLFFAIGTSVFSGYSDILFRHFNNTLYRRGISAATTKQIDQTINFHFLG